MVECISVYIKDIKPYVWVFCNINLSHAKYEHVNVP